MTVSELRDLLSYANDNWDVTMNIKKISTEEGEINWFSNIKALKFDKNYGEVRLVN